MKEILAVVNHWDGGAPGKEIDSLKRWMINSESGLFYHRFVSGDIVNYGASTSKKLSHCGAPVYTDEAVSYFGIYCPDWDHRVRPHNNSPNNCAIGVCLLHDFEGGGYSEKTLLSSAKLNGELLSYYGLDIRGCWTHSMICGEKYKHCPKEFVEKPEQWELFKDMVRHYL